MSPALIRLEISKLTTFLTSPCVREANEEAIRGQLTTSRNGRKRNSRGIDCMQLFLMSDSKRTHFNVLSLFSHFVCVWYRLKNLVCCRRGRFSSIFIPEGRGCVVWCVCHKLKIAVWSKTEIYENGIVVKMENVWHRLTNPVQSKIDRERSVVVESLSILIPQWKGGVAQKKQ